MQGRQHRSIGWWAVIACRLWYLHDSFHSLVCCLQHFCRGTLLILSCLDYRGTSAALHQSALQLQWYICQSNRYGISERPWFDANLELVNRAPSGSIRTYQSPPSSHRTCTNIAPARFRHPLWRCHLGFQLIISLDLLFACVCHQFEANQSFSAKSSGGKARPARYQIKVHADLKLILRGCPRTLVSEPRDFPFPLKPLEATRVISFRSFTF